LRTQLAALVAAGRSRLILDLTALVFCDSTGIGTLVRGNNDCHSVDGYLRLAAPNRNVARVLSVVGLLDTFPTYRTVEAARRADGNALVAAEG
jgi:anti-anti-sigma factor